MAKRNKISNTEIYPAIIAFVVVIILNPRIFSVFSYPFIFVVIAFTTFGLFIYKKKAVNTTSTQSKRNEPLINLEALKNQQSEISYTKQDRITEWSLKLIDSLEWKRFEELCASYFSAKGYKTEMSRQGADGGVDIYLYKESYSTTKVFGIIQCKAWNTYKVGVKPVRELLGVMTAEQAPLGIFITSGTYTKEAEDFAKGKTLKLLNGESLLRLLKSLPEDTQHSILDHVTRGDYLTPTCPSCDSKMIKRKSTKGKNEGNEFWGCTNYPKCRNTLRIRNV